MGIMAAIGEFFPFLKKTNDHNYINKIIKKIPKEIYYTLILFFATRIILTFIATLSRVYQNGSNFHDYTKYVFLNIWGVWDSWWYVDVAENGYSTILNSSGQANYVFFPLYPMSMKFLGVIVNALMNFTGVVIGNPYYLAGLLISNIALLVSCVYLYKLVKLDDDEETALSSIKYLLLFPTAFILSGVFSESIFLALLIASFYYAKKGNWYLAGGLGFLLSLSRSLGFLVILPLAYEYLKTKKFNYRNIDKEILPLLCIPLGLLLFSAYNYYLTGDFLAFGHNQDSYGRFLSNPLQVLIVNLTQSMTSFIWSASVILTLLLLTVYIKKIGFSYWLLGMYSIILPVATGNLICIPRYMLAVFPFFILFAKLSKNRDVDLLLTTVCALLQGYLIAHWTLQTVLIM